MGQKEPIVEKNGCLKEYYIQLERTFERKQHYDVPCVINCQGTFMMEFH